MINVKKTVSVEDIRFYNKYAVRVFDVIKKADKIEGLEYLINENFSVITEEELEDFIWLDFKYIFEELNIDVPEEIKKDFIIITDILVENVDNANCNGGNYPELIIKYKEYDGTIREYKSRTCACHRGCSSTDNISNIEIGDVYSSIDELYYYLNH